MATVFQGGYVGGPTARPVDLSPLQQGLQQRNQRLDAIPMAEFEALGPVGAAYIASTGNEAMERFLNRYYGGDSWRAYIPEVGEQKIQDSSGNKVVAPTFIAPANVPWDQEMRRALEEQVFGLTFESAPQEQQPAEGAAPPQKETTVDGQVVGAKDKTTEVVPPEQSTPPPEVGTTSTAPPAESAPVAPPVAVRSGASAIDRSGTQDQLMVEDPEVARQLQYQADVVARRAGETFNETDPAQRTAAMVESEVIPALVEYMATPGRGLGEGNPFGRGGLVDQIVTQRLGEEGLTYLDTSQPGTWRDAIHNRVRAELSARGLGMFGTPLAPGAQTGMAPEPAANEAARKAAEAAGQTAPRPKTTPSSQSEGAGVFYDEFGNPVPGGEPTSMWPHVGEVVGGRTAQAGGDVRTDAVNTIATDEMLRENPLSGMAPPNTQQSLILQTIENSLAESRRRAAVMAMDTEGQIRDEQMEIRRKANERPALHVGDTDIPINNPTEQAMANHLSHLGDEGSRGRAAEAAVNNAVRTAAPDIRRGVKASMQTRGTMVPAGAFARQVDQFIRNDPAGAAMYFNDMATSFLSAQESEGRARESAARARSMERENEAAEALGPEFDQALVTERLRGLQLANNMTELQLDYAPQQFEAGILESLTAIGVNRINAQAIADGIGLARAQMELEAQLLAMREAGELANVMNEQDLKRVDYILKALEAGPPPEIAEKLRNELWAATSGYTFTGEERAAFGKLFAGIGSFFSAGVTPGYRSQTTTPVPGFQSFTNPFGAPPVDQGDAGEADPLLGAYGTR